MAGQKQRGGLGKGLGALLSADLTEDYEKNVVKQLDIHEVYPNRDQPRKQFDDENLKELSDSIRESGVIIPIIVSKTEKGYLIVAGERRWRASKLAGLTEIPAIVRELSGVEILQQALIENIQRQDLNPLEEAEALSRLIRGYQMKQEQVSAMVGKSRPAITNMLRLLNLSPKVKDMLLHEDLTAGHARALLPIADEAAQVDMADKIIQEQLSVRQTEQMVKAFLNPKPKKTPQPATKAYLQSIRTVEDRFTRAFGTKVKLRDRHNKGQIMIEYYSHEDLERILEMVES